MYDLISIATFPDGGWCNEEWIKLFHHTNVNMFKGYILIIDNAILSLDWQNNLVNTGNIDSDSDFRVLISTVTGIAANHTETYRRKNSTRYLAK